MVVRERERVCVCIGAGIIKDWLEFQSRRGCKAVRCSLELVSLAHDLRQKTFRAEVSGGVSARTFKCTTRPHW